MLTEQDKEEIRSYVSSSRSEEEKKERRKEMAKKKDVSIAVIAAVSAWDTGKLKALKEAKEALSTLSHPRLPEVSPQVQAIRDRLLSATARASQPPVVRPAHIVTDTDYDNITKAKWRDCWGAFISKNIPASLRSKKRILCMPGRACLEIPLYLNLGFDPKNIVGVEGYEPYKADFLHNARKFGIVARLGRLEDGMLADDVLPYDIVSYDFTGPFCGVTKEILRETFLAPAWGTYINTDALLMINIMGKREPTGAQDTLDSYAAFSNEEEFLEEAIEEDDPFRRFEKLYEKSDEILERHEKEGNGMTLAEKRERTLACVISDLLGKARRRRESPYQKRLSDLHAESGGCINEVFGLVFGAFDRFLVNHGIKSGVAGSSVVALIQCMQQVMAQMPIVTQLQPYRYISKAGKGNSPFLTEMMVLHTPMDRYGHARHMVTYFLDCCQAQLRATAVGYFQSRGQNGIVRPQGQGLAKGDRIEFIADGQNANSCQMRRLFDSYSNFVDHIDDDVAVAKLHKRVDIPRMLIQ